MAKTSAAMPETMVEAIVARGVQVEILPGIVVITSIVIVICVVITIPSRNSLA